MYDTAAVSLAIAGSYVYGAAFDCYMLWKIHFTIFQKLKIAEVQVTAKEIMSGSINTGNIFDLFGS